MEGTKYSQHNQTHNIACIILVWHIRQNYAKLPDQFFTSMKPSNANTNLDFPESLLSWELHTILNFNFKIDSVR